MTGDTESTTAQRTARRGSPTHVVVGDHVGAVLADQLAAAGCDVALVPADDARPTTDVPVYDVDPTDASEFEAAGGGARTVVAATDDDATNLLVAQLARTHVDADRVVVRVNDPKAAPTFEDVDGRAISAPAILGSALAGAAVDSDFRAAGGSGDASRDGADGRGPLRRLVDETIEKR